MQAAAWDSKGELEFQIATDPDLWYSSGASPVTPQGDITVKAVTIDEVIPAADSVDFIKMDIEGSERHALRGAAQTLSRSKPKIAVCVYHRRDDREVLPQIIKGARPDYEHRIAGHQHYFR